ncbi:MAG: chemotaxis protein CheY-P-specific phosphatase CheC [Desulforhopalus sp.]|jgi:chemotaxis protein CheY-P-specific phosphatase CheC
MKQQKRVDKILQAVKSRVQEEVGALLGTVFVLNTESYQRTTKEDLFGQLQGKQICAEMDITGDISGKGCLLVGIKDAIFLGGTLIMLPGAELDEVMGREEYSEEIEDSYGEIANIIAGSFTKDFEEMYPKSCRFVRKNQEKLIPRKVEIESDEPVENRQLYQVSWSMELDGSPMGNMVMLLPAATFELEEEVGVDSAEPLGNEQAELQSENVVPDSDTDAADIENIATPPSVDFEKQKKKVDRLLDECQNRLQNEVGGLLGVTTVLSDIRNYFVNKEEFFEDRVVGRQVIAEMEVVGDVEDKSFFCIGIKDAVHLGGVLIMLPPSELETTVKEEEFGEDAQDAYGEVANIVSGVYTAVFEEQYNKKFRFIKKCLSEVLPAKVEIESEEPIPDMLYYANSLALSVDGKELGRVQMLFPAAMLDLHPPQPVGAEPSIQQESSSEPVTSQVESDDNRNVEPVINNQELQLEAAKHRTKVDGLLADCQKKMQEEVSNLLGTDVEMANIDNKVINKEDFFFDEVSAKQVIATMDVVGEVEGQCFLSVDLKDAIRVGGVLIMLPAAELDSVVADEDFGEDAADAYGEIANIISGVYTAVFEKQYTKNIRFIKKDLQQVAPMKIDVESDEPIPNSDYYLSSMDLVIGGTSFGKVNFLFPLNLLELEGLLIVDEPAAIENAAAVSLGRTDGNVDELERTKKASSARDSIDILIIGDDEGAASTIRTTMIEMGYSAKTLSFKDNIHDYIPGELKAVYLVMNNVNEQGFGTAIKISTACALPLIAAGPGWTKSKVIKAVKYGVRDILLTPATVDNIKENINNNLLDMAA